MECLSNLLELVCWGLLVVLIAIAIGTEISLYVKKAKKMTQIDILISENRSDIDFLKAELEKIEKSKYVGSSTAQIRDYFVRTKYIGKLEDKRIIEDYKNEVGDFEAMKNDLLNYNNLSKFESYRETLRKYEYKQIILNTYPTKKETK